MKASAHNLSLVLELAQRKRDLALQALAQVQQEQKHALLQLSQLQGYGSESTLRWSERAAQGVSTVQLHTQQRFMGRIEHALAYQGQVLEQLAQRLRQCQQQVLEAERELASLRKFQQRQQQVLQLRQQRLEQKANDEMAATQHRRHASNHPWKPTP